jgi:hypothetical protein
MLDANMEIDKLRQRLRFKNLSEQVISSICDDVATDISRASVDILANAMEEAVMAGAEAKSIKFINELKVVQSSNRFSISTDSGKHDFSEPPFPMLPKLLKNAKTAKDGSQYKIIPVRQKGTKRNTGRMGVTTEAALKNINEARRIAKEARDARGDDFVGQIAPDALKGMSTFAALQAINEARKAFPTMSQKSTEPVVAYRTASSKQDANNKWVQPAKQVNMGPALHSINAKLQNSLDNVIEDVIRRHEGMY